MVKLENFEQVPMYSVYIGFLKNGPESGYAKAYAKGIIFENNGLTPLFLYDKSNSVLYVVSKENFEKTITLH